MKHAENAVVVSQSENLNQEQAAFYEHLALQRLKELQESPRNAGWLWQILKSLAWLFKKPEVYLNGSVSEQRALRRTSIDRQLL